MFTYILVGKNHSPNVVIFILLYKIGTDALHTYFGGSPSCNVPLGTQ